MAASAQLLQQPAALAEAELTDWGPVAEPIGTPVAHTRGRLLHRDPDGANETGLWMCTPGTWRCHVTRDEFCQFLSGACTYTAADGTRLDIQGGDAAFFPAGWRGVCEVRQTVRKTYMIR
ncbi:MAG TPA: cupin domain-containing protein [Kiloniellales bacterium]